MGRRIPVTGQQESGLAQKRQREDLFLFLNPTDEESLRWQVLRKPARSAALIKRTTGLHSNRHDRLFFARHTALSSA